MRHTILAALAFAVSVSVIAAAQQPAFDDAIQAAVSWMLRTCGRS